MFKTLFKIQSFSLKHYLKVEVSLSMTQKNTFDKL